MELNRRDFLKASGTGIGGVFLLGALSDNVALAAPIKHIPLKKQGKEIPAELERTHKKVTLDKCDSYEKCE